MTQTAARETLDEIRRMAAVRHGAGGDRELRTVTGVPAEVRENGDGNTLVGHAAVFDKETVIGRFFREKIKPGAFAKTIKEADVRHLFNHNPDIVLARSAPAKGISTLRLSEDDIGLAFEADLNMDDPDAQRVKAKVARGDVDQSSFAFRVIKESWEEGDVDEATGTRRLPLRIIEEAQLFDTSTVTYPAYEEADTGLRAVGLGILSNVLGLSEGARSIILRAVEGQGELPDELQSAVAQFRQALDAAAGKRDEEPETEPAAEAGGDGTDEPAAEEAPATGEEPGGEDPEPAAEEAPEDDQTDEAAPEADDDGTDDDEAERAKRLAILEFRRRQMQMGATSDS